MGQNPYHIIDLVQAYKEDEDLVGKKAHELGMLWKLGIPLPNGFIITTEFFKEFLRQTGICDEIKKVQDLNHPAISDSIEKLFHPIQRKILQENIPHNLSIQLHKYYRELSGTFKECPLSVFSSGSNNKSILFANVKGDTNLVLKIKKIWSSCFKESVAVVVQKDIKSKIKGKVFTDNPIVDKKLTDEQMNKLADYCRIIQRHFYFPKEIEYIISKEKIFITEINPFTGCVNESPKALIPNIKKQKVLIKGFSVNPGIVTGIVKILRSNDNVAEAKKGEIILLPHLDSSMFKKMKNSKAVIIDSVSPNSLNKTLYRKYFQIPTIEGAKNATKMFQNGNVVTVNGVSGEIYSGGLVY